MNDEFWEKFWQQNEKIHKIEKRVAILEEDDKTTTEVQEEVADQNQWIFSVVKTIVTIVISVIATSIIILNYIR